MSVRAHDAFLNEMQAKLKRKVDFDISEIAIQTLLASTLRKLAISHLEKSDGVVAKNFRGEYSYVEPVLGPYESFLKEQAEEGTWGTYLEATALAELFQVHLVVTPVKNGEEQGPICLYRASDDNAPVVHLQNSNDSHWYVNNQTKGDGNCLYNAFAQALQSIVKADASKHPQLNEAKAPKTWIEREADNVSTPASATAPRRRVDIQEHSSNRSSTHEENMAINTQRELFNHIVKQKPSPAEMEQELKAEHDRIKRLGADEQKQIADDYEFALKLAREEDFAYDNTPPSPSLSRI